MIAAFLGIIALYAASNYYIASRLWRWLGLTKGLWAFGAVFVFLSSVFMLSEMIPGMPYGLKRPINIIGGLYLAAYIFLIILVPICDIVFKGMGGALTALLIIAAAVAITAFGFASANNIKTKSYTVNTGSGDMKIALVSDMHIGEIITARQVEKMVDSINAVGADYIFIAGDLLDAGPDTVRDKEAVGHAMSRLSAPGGVYACLGNHDGGFRGLESEAEELLESWGINVLRDEAVIKDDIAIVGRNDKDYPGRKSAEEVLADIPDELFTVVLDHQPTDFDAEKAAGADLILCGHTHRGQVFPCNLITRAVFKLDYGMMTEDGCTMIVSSGIGTWGPRVRIGSQSEVVDISITK